MFSETRCDFCREVILSQAAVRIEFGFALSNRPEDAHFCLRCAPRSVEALAEGRAAVVARLKLGGEQADAAR